MFAEGKGLEPVEGYLGTSTQTAMRVTLAVKPRTHCQEKQGTEYIRYISVKGNDEK
jgi:hypothetical protein